MPRIPFKTRLAPPEGSAAKIRHMREIDQCIAALRACVDPANNLTYSKATTNSRIDASLRTAELFRIAARSGAYTYRAGMTRGIRLTQSYVQASDAGVLEAVGITGLKELRRETRKIRNKIAYDLARQAHAKVAIVELATKTYKRTLAFVLSSSAYAVASCAYAMRDLNYSRTTVVLLAMATTVTAPFVAKRKAKGQKQSSKKNMSKRFASHPATVGLASAAVTFALFKEWLSTSDMLVILGSLSAMVAGLAAGTSKLIEYATLRSKKIMMKQGNPFKIVGK